MGQYLRIKAEHCGKEYPWPNAKNPDQTLMLFHDDVLTKDPNGTYWKHTGIMVGNLHIPADHIEPWPHPVNLVMDHSGDAPTAYPRCLLDGAGASPE